MKFFNSLELAYRRCLHLLLILSYVVSSVLSYILMEGKVNFGGIKGEPENLHRLFFHSPCKMSFMSIRGFAFFKNGISLKRLFGVMILDFLGGAYLDFIEEARNSSRAMSRSFMGVMAS